MGVLQLICGSIRNNDYVTRNLDSHLFGYIEQAGGNWKGLRHATMALPTAFVGLAESITRLAIAVISLVPVVVILAMKGCGLKSTLADKIGTFAGANFGYSIASGLLVWSLFGSACVLPFTKDSDFLKAQVQW